MKLPNAILCCKSMNDANIINYSVSYVKWLVDVERDISYLDIQHFAATDFADQKFE